MAKYEKWLGAGLGWMLTGNPLGGVLGFFAGTLINSGDKEKTKTEVKGVSEFEVNLIVLASHLMKIDGWASTAEIAFTERFFNTHFDGKYAVERAGIINHCIHKEYDLTAACGQIRMYSSASTKIQVVRFLIDLAQSDGQITEREDYFIFRIAGYINVNDVDYRKIKAEHPYHVFTPYEILGVSSVMSFEEIRATYRRLVLQYHPDRNKDASEEERKQLAQKFQQIKEAYTKIKAERT